jgi:hypothetical protein
MPKVVEPCVEVTVINTASTLTRGFLPLTEGGLQPSKQLSCLIVMSRPFNAPQDCDLAALAKATQGELRLRKRGCPGVHPCVETQSSRHGRRANPTGFVSNRKTTFFLLRYKQNAGQHYADNKN